MMKNYEDWLDELDSCLVLVTGKLFPLTASVCVAIGIAYEAGMSPQKAANEIINSQFDERK